MCVCVCVKEKTPVQTCHDTINSAPFIKDNGNIATICLIVTRNDGFKEKKN